MRKEGIFVAFVITSSLKYAHENGCPLPDYFSTLANHSYINEGKGDTV